MKTLFFFLLLTGHLHYETIEKKEREINKKTKKPTPEFLIPLHNPATGKTDYINFAQLIGGITIYVNTTNNAQTDAKAIVTPSKELATVSQESSSFFSLPTLKKHYLYYLAGGLLASYLFVYFRLKKALWLMGNRDAWCNWKGECSLEKLFTFSQEELAEELLLKIQARYSNPRTPGDLVTPLSEFLDQYKKEIETLRTYVKTVQMLRTFKASNLFPLHEEDIFAIKEKTQRLAFLKTLFFLWTTNHSKEKHLLQKKIYRTFLHTNPSF